MPNPVQEIAERLCRNVERVLVWPAADARVERVDRRDLDRLREKPNMSRSSAMREGRTDFGMAERRLGMCQRSTTWAGVLPWRSAIPAMTGSIGRSNRTVGLPLLCP